MTEPREVVVTDEEIKALLTAVNMTCPNALIPYFRQALAAFLAARVPDAITMFNRIPSSVEIVKAEGHNACRAAVLRGLDQ